MPVHTVTHFEKSVENWSVVRVTIVGESFLLVVERQDYTTKYNAKNQQCVTIIVLFQYQLVITVLIPVLQP